jgi:hypothetical protein
MDKITVRTRYYGPTDFKGSCIRARMSGKQLTIPYDHGVNDPHLKAAQALADKIHGTASLVRTEITETGYVYTVFPNDLGTVTEGN